MKRLWIIYVLVGVVVVMFGNEVVAADKPEKVRIGFLSLVNGQLISKDQKFHEQEMGVPVEWFQFDSGRDVNTAMASGSLDFGNLGLPPVTIGVSGGMKYWGVFNANILGAVESLVARPPIAGVKDLVGKTVVCPFGSTTHYLLLKALNMNGVDPSKLKILDMSPSESLAAFMRKDIDAARKGHGVCRRLVDHAEVPQRPFGGGRDADQQGGALALGLGRLAVDLHRPERRAGG